MADTLSVQEADQEFLAECEEELKDRFTEKDDEFMKVFTSDPSKPPVIDSWWSSNSGGRRNDRYNNRRDPYDRNRERDGVRNPNRNHRDYRRDDRRQGYRPQRQRYHY